MSLKTKKRLKEKQQLDLFYKLKKTIENPAYLKDYKEFQKKNELITSKVMYIMRQFNFRGFSNDEKYLNLIQKLHKLASELRHKYNIPLLFDPAFKDIKSLIFYPVGFGSIISSNNESLKTQASKRYISYIIDTYEDTEILKYDLTEQITTLNAVRRNFGIKIPKKPHLRNFERCMKVFEFRNQRPPVKYEKIALKLLKYYNGKNKSLERIVDNCKKDYEVAFEQVYHIPYKKYDKSELKKSDFKTCSGCNKYNSCKELCAEAEYALTQVESKRKERLFDKGVTDII